MTVVIGVQAYRRNLFAELDRVKDPRLTDSADRETYAALISYLDSLPPSDELFASWSCLGLLCQS